VGLDISPAMIDQGRKNYAGCATVRFEEADLGDGFPLGEEAPFDIYFSSYSSLSHITDEELAALTCQILQHVRGRAYLVYDLLGRFSPEWPQYWREDARARLPYNMAYLLGPEERTPERVENFPVTYWSAAELEALVAAAARATGRRAAVAVRKDRSILIGRHMDTGLLNDHPLAVRRAVNCLFERDYRGDVAHLGMDLAFLDAYRDVHPEAYARIRQYHSDWMTVVGVYAALAASDNATVKRLIEEARPDLSDELKMLAWIFRNAARFPAVDFWGSVMGPQVACVLRNLEYGLPPALGCGHGLLAVVEIKEP
jgi:SAM-dependent methyltransferase